MAEALADVSDEEFTGSLFPLDEIPVSKPTTEDLLLASKEEKALGAIHMNKLRDDFNRLTPDRNYANFGQLAIEAFLPHGHPQTA